MKEIVNRLHESRQIELAKHLLELEGYIISHMNENQSRRESSYNDPIRFSIEISGAKLSPEEFASIVQSLKYSPEILEDNSDGTYQICVPSEREWSDIISDAIKEKYPDSHLSMI